MKNFFVTFHSMNQSQEFKLKMQSLKLRREELNSKEHELRQSLANFEKYINVNIHFCFSYLKKISRVT